MKPVIFHVLGQPVAKGRPRMTRGGNAYTPAKTRKYEAHARMAAQAGMAGRQPVSGPVAMDVHVELPIPQSWPKRKQQQALIGEIRPTSRPDIDNYVKAALDACNEIVFSDDSQVVQISARKTYGEQPKLVVCVKPIAMEAAA